MRPWHYSAPWHWNGTAARWVESARRAEATRHNRTFHPHNPLTKPLSLPLPLGAGVLLYPMNSWLVLCSWQFAELLASQACLDLACDYAPSIEPATVP
jgi:hypothetical protein